MKCNENIYFKARKLAAEKDKRLSSREKASEILAIHPATLAGYELGTTKNVPVDMVVMMSDLYKTPELMQSYCKNECPIGKYKTIITEAGPIQSIAIKMACMINIQQLQTVKDTILLIAKDGMIDEDEYVEPPMKWQGRR